MKYKKVTNQTISKEDSARLLWEHRAGMLHSLVVTTDNQDTYINIDGEEKEVELASPSEINTIFAEETNIDGVFLDNIRFDTSNDIFTQRVKFGEKGKFNRVEITLVNPSEGEVVYSYQVVYEVK